MTAIVDRIGQDSARQKKGGDNGGAAVEQVGPAIKTHSNTENTSGFLRAMPWLAISPDFDVWFRGVLYGGGLVLTTQFIAVLCAALFLFDLTRQRNTSVSAPSKPSPNNEIDDELPPDAWPPGVVTFLEQSLRPSPSTEQPRQGDTSNAFAAAPSLNAQLDASTSESIQFEWDAASPEMSAADTAPWLNLLVARFFLSLRESSVFKSRMCAKLMERMNSRLKGNSFVSHVKLHDIVLGDNVPIVHGVRLLKVVTDDLAVCLEIDISYEGGASVGIEPTLTAGLPIPVRASINALEGKLRVRVPAIGYPDMFAVSFLEDPGVSFKVEAPTITLRDNNMLRGVVTSVLSEIVRRVFVDMWVLPAWRTFFLPLMIPPVEEEMSRMDEVNSLSRDAKNAASNSKRSSKMADYFQQALAKRDPAMRDRLFRTLTSSSSNPSLSGNTSGLRVLEFVDVEAFPVSIAWDSALQHADQLEDAMLLPFLSLARESTFSPWIRTGNTVDTEWKTVKNNSGVALRKCKKKMEGVAYGEAYHATINISCDAEWVYSILKNPDHWSHIEYAIYMDSKTLSQIDESRTIRQHVFKIKGSLKTLTVFEVQKRIAADKSLPHLKDSFVVISRSINSRFETETVPLYSELTNSNSPVLPASALSSAQNPLPTDVESIRSRSPSPGVLPESRSNSRSNSPSKQLKLAFPPQRDSSFSGTQTNLPSVRHATVYLHGYLIEPHPTNAAACTVTVISQLSPDLARLETNHAACRRLKSFVEEVKMALEHTDAGGSARKGAASVGGIAGFMASARGQELRNYLVSSSASAAGYIKSTAGSMRSASLLKRSATAGSSAGNENGDEQDDLSEYEEPHDALASETASTAETASAVSKPGDQPAKKKVDLMSSAVAIAKNVRMNKTNIGFLTRAALVAAGGGNADSESGNSLSGEKSGDPFSIGNKPDSVQFGYRKLAAKEIIQIEVPFNREDYQSVELSWEFYVKDELQILFGVMFKPTVPNDKPDSMKNLSVLLPESVSEYGTRQIVPVSSITTHQVPFCRGNLCLSSFPSGTFVFLWDNVNGAKKQERELFFRSVVRPFDAPRPVPSLEESQIGEFGFGLSGRGQHCTGITGEVVVARKSLYRAFFTYDQTMEAEPDANGEVQTVTFLAWDFSTNGLEISFGIVYYPSGASVLPNAASHESLSEASDSMKPVRGPDEQGDSTVEGSEGDLRLLRYVSLKSLLATAPNSLPIPPAPQKPPRRVPGSSEASSFEKPSLATRLAAVTVKDHNEQPSSADSNKSFPALDSSMVSPSFSAQTLQPTPQPTPTSLIRHRVKPITVVPLAKVRSSAGSTTAGTLPVDPTKKGVYVFVWDNTSSVMLPKVVAFRVGLVTTCLRSQEVDNMSEDSPVRNGENVSDV